MLERTQERVPEVLSPSFDAHYFLAFESGGKVFGGGVFEYDGIVELEDSLVGTGGGSYGFDVNDRLILEDLLENCSRTLDFRNLRHCRCSSMYNTVISSAKQSESEARRVFSTPIPWLGRPTVRGPHHLLGTSSQFHHSGICCC
jgi:hypothetical protein